MSPLVLIRVCLEPILSMAALAISVPRSRMSHSLWSQVVNFITARRSEATESSLGVGGGAGAGGALPYVRAARSA